MREFRSDQRSEHNRYIECEHHLALEESQLRLQKVRNEGLQSQLALSENRLSEESSSSEQSGMRDMRIMGLRSELHMKQSLLDRMQTQVTKSKNQYHELSCQLARRSSPGASPSHDFFFGMYAKLRSEYDKFRQSKKETDGMYMEMRAELADNKNLIKTYQKTYDDLGRKCDDALLKIDKMSTNWHKPNLFWKSFW